MKGFIASVERNEKIVDLVNKAKKDLSILAWCEKVGISYHVLNTVSKNDYSPMTCYYGKLSETTVRLMDVLGCIPEDLWDNSVLYPLETNFCEFDNIEKDVLQKASEEFRYNCPSEYLEMEQFVDIVHETIEKLSNDKYKDIIRMRFGIDRDKEYTLDEVGEKYNVTRERVRQMEAKALRVLRHPSRSDKLRCLIDDEYDFELLDRKRNAIVKKQQQTEELNLYIKRTLESLSNNVDERQSFLRALSLARVKGRKHK